MPRKSRIDAPGALHHVVVRGINRQDIFSDHKDYSVFMEWLGDLSIETKTSCYAWTLIPNHFHLVLRTGNVPISVFMKRLLTGYAVNHNRSHNRSGHLFQNRYKSILCQEVSLLRETGDYQTGDERILGDGHFVKQVLAKAEEKFKRKYRLKLQGYDLNKLINRISEITGVNSTQILDSQRDKRRTDARSILCFWGKEELGMTQRQLALVLNLTPPAISHAVRRGRMLVENNSYSINAK
jgi:REP element-mobilizing transposase RayT